MRQSMASAPGKVILSGEHFVVHGSSSVAAAISKRVFVTVREIDGTKPRIVSGNLISYLNSNDGNFQAVKTVVREIFSQRRSLETNPFEITIESEIPVGSGLGSSSAVSVACAAALIDFLDLPKKELDVGNFAFKGEKAVHGNPSGIDIQASLRGGLILFKKEAETRSINVRKPFKILVVYSGRKRSTSRLIARVARKKADYPNYFQRLADFASETSREVVEVCRDQDAHRMGTLFSEAQAWLAWIGVSTPDLESIIEFLYSNESVFGAKLTGAGGGGSVIAAIQQDATEEILKLVSRKYPESFVSEIPQEGLLWGKS
jgi:mevalonate kinase